MARTKAPDESKLSPHQKAILDLLQKGRAPDQIARSRKTSTNAVYQTMRRLRAAGFDIPTPNGARGNGSARKTTTRRRNRRAAAPPPPTTPPEEPTFDPDSRIEEARSAIEAERVTLDKQRENAQAQRERFIAEAAAREKVIGEIEAAIFRLDHVLAGFDAKIEAPA